MRLALAFTSIGFALLLTSESASAPVMAQTVIQRAVRLPDPIIESIEVAHVSPHVRSVVLSRIGIRTGDVLTNRAKQTIGVEIGRVIKGMTFSYAPGVQPGTVKLLIDSGC